MKQVAVISGEADKEILIHLPVRPSMRQDERQDT
jgi:hypothetical protein